MSIQAEDQDSEVSVEESTEAESLGDKQPSPRKCCNTSVLRLLGACLCIVGAIATWVFMAEKLQGLNNKYNKPYFLTYWVHSLYSLMYIFWSIWRRFPGNFSCNRVGEGLQTKFRPLLLVSGILAVISFIGGYTWYLSLTRTNIPANTAIYQSTSAIVFIISIPILRERVTVMKVVCVVFSVVGVTLVALFSSHDHCTSSSPSHNVTHSHRTNISHMLTLDSGNNCVEKSTPLGYVFLVVGVITYSLFEVLYKRLATKKGDPASVPNGVRFLGYIGVHTLLWLWPPIIVLHFARVEVFEWPSWDILGMMTLNGLFDVIFNGCILVSIVLSSPLFTSVGTILAIPTSVVVDLIVHGYLLPWQAGVGIALIVMGFGGFTISEFVATRREARHKLLERQKHLKLAASDHYNDEKLPLLRRKRKVELKTVAKYLV